MTSSLHIIGSGGFGGAERFFVRLVQALHEAGQPVVAVSRPRGMVAPELGPDIAHHGVPLRNVLDLPSRWAIRRLARELRPDIVQTYMGRATRLTRLKGRGPVHIARLGGFYKLDGYRHAEAWVGNTTAICDYLREGGFPAERVFYIHNFVDLAPPLADAELAAARARFAIPADAMVVAGVGRLVEKKGFQDLLAAFARLPAELGGQPLHLLIAGDGPLAGALREQTRALGLESRVHWAGWQRDPAPVYQLAEVFVCPSRHEPLGNVILEAWSHGRPVLSTASHGARELITPDESGVLVPCEAPLRMAEALEALLLDAPARRQIASAGRAVAGGRYGRASVVESYLSLYDELLRRLR